MASLPTLLTASCLLSVLGLLVAEARDWRTGKILLKLLASTLFVGLALALGGAQSNPGRLLLLAFVLCWVGDACLLSRRPIAFLAGLGAFLLGHVAFAAAFFTTPGRADPSVLTLGVLLLIGLAVLRWLWPHVRGVFRYAVVAYVLAILSMCAWAAGLSAGTGVGWAIAGAAAFAVSDLAVARDRFVSPGFINTLWGLPLYYLGQVLLAWSQHFLAHPVA